MGRTGDLCEIPGEVKFVWKINSFFILSHEANARYESSKFYFSGASWEMRIYPNGETKNASNGWISLYLARTSTGFPLTMNYSFSFQTAGGKACTRMYTNVIDKKNIGWGISKFISRSVLMERKSELVPSGVLTVICILKNSEPVDLAGSSFHRLQEISDNLHEIFTKENMTDLNLKLSEGNIQAHRMILETRSPVFASMLQNDKQGDQEVELTIDDTDRSTMNNLLLHMYSGDTDNMTSQNVLPLYAAAKKYGLKDIQEICMEFIVRTMSVEWVCDIISFAELYHEKEISRRARKYFRENAYEVLQNENWKTFAKENQDLSSELLGSMVKGLLQERKTAN